MGGGVGSSRAMRNPTGQGGVDLAMNAYHGSPYDIKSGFDIQRIGTGEGAQVYGHGMYFAESRPTAQSFADALKNKGFNFKAEEERLGFELPSSARGQFMQLAQKYPDDPMKAAGWIQSGNIAARDIPQEKIADLFTAYKEKTQGNLYKVDIPDEAIPKMLDWDKPLSKQSPEVLSILKNNPAVMSDLKGNKTLDDLTGKDAYLAIASSFDVGQKDAYKLASEFLNQQGIPGVRYADDGRRGAKPGASNFVVFDPSTVKMLEKNDMPLEKLLEEGLLGN
jgi:hypothetical protein